MDAIRNAVRRLPPEHSVRRVLGTLRRAAGLPRRVTWKLRFTASRPSQGTAAVTFRASQPTSDTFPLLEMLAAAGFEKVFLISQDDAFPKRIVARYRRELPSIEITVAYQTSRKIEAVKASSLIVYQDPEGVPDPIWDAINTRRGARTLVQIDHGLTAKGPTNQDGARPVYSAGGLPVDGTQLSWLCSRPRFGVRVSQNALHAYMLRANLQPSAGKRPSFIRPLGYPKFVRAAELRSGCKSPIVLDDVDPLPPMARASQRILYAPTRLDVIPDLGEEAWPSLLRYLELNDIVLIPRNHPLVEDLGSIPQHSKIVKIDRHAFLSTVDFLCFIDVLITDRSSIAMDALAMDIPTIFVDSLAPENYTVETFIARPGAIVKDTGELLARLDQALNSSAGDNDAAYRQFHRQLWGLTEATTSALKWKVFLSRGSP